MSIRQFIFILFSSLLLLPPLRLRRRATVVTAVVVATGATAAVVAAIAAVVLPRVCGLALATHAAFFVLVVSRGRRDCGACRVRACSACLAVRVVLVVHAVPRLSRL